MFIGLHVLRSIYTVGLRKVFFCVGHVTPQVSVRTTIGNDTYRQVLCFVTTTSWTKQVLLRQNERRREAALMQVVSDKVLYIANVRGSLTHSCDAAFIADKVVCRGRPVYIQCMPIQILLMRMMCSRNKL